MKANELRIGNLIEYNGKEFVVVEIRKNTLRIKHWSGMTSVISIYDCKHILLTEEKLIELGFEKKPCGYRSSKYVKGIIELHNYGGDVFKNMEIAMVEAYESDNEQDTISVMLHYDVMYVHELQNIYSIFTREELELKQ